RALLTAIEEVENAFVAFDSAGTQREELRLALETSQRAQERASAFYQRGLVDYGAYLDTQRVALQTEDALIQATMRRALAVIALYRAFGGGISAGSESRAAGDRNDLRDFEDLSRRQPTQDDLERLGVGHDRMSISPPVIRLWSTDLDARGTGLDAFQEKSRCDS